MPNWLTPALNCLAVSRLHTSGSTSYAAGAALEVCGAVAGVGEEFEYLAAGKVRFRWTSSGKDVAPDGVADPPRRRSTRLAVAGRGGAPCPFDGVVVAPPHRVAPFPKPATGRIAIKAINLGDEALRVFNQLKGRIRSKAADYSAHGS